MKREGLMSCREEESAPRLQQARSLAVKLADDPDELDQVFRLRHRVFIEEAGLPATEDARERDHYDDLCDHLIVKDVERGLVAGVYRMLPGARRDSRGFYSESEFDLAAFAPNFPETLELGRSCIHPAYRGSDAMPLLWNGMLAHYLAGFRYLIGCVSVPVAAVDELNEVFTLFHEMGLMSERFGIRAHDALRVQGVRRLATIDDEAVKRRLPPLMKAYIRIGAEVVPDPIYDPVLATHDFFMVLERDRVPARYHRAAGVAE